MKRAGLLAIGAIVLLGGFLQQAPQYCPVPLRSFLGVDERRVPIPQARPAAVPVETTGRDAERLAAATRDLQSADPARRVRALEVLANLRQPASDALIARARRDPEPDVARRAEELLARRSTSR